VKGFDLFGDRFGGLDLKAKPSILEADRGLLGEARVPARWKSPSATASMLSVRIFIDVATIWQVIWAHAASASRRRSPEQAALPEPSAPAWASASYECPPMFTEQAIGVPDSLAFASSVIPEEPGWLRYFSFRGFWIARRSVLMLPTFAVADLSYQV